MMDMYYTLCMYIFLKFDLSRDWDQLTLRMNPNIKSLLDSSKSKDRSSLNEGYKQLKELESKALEYQRENTVSTVNQISVVL